MKAPAYAGRVSAWRGALCLGRVLACMARAAGPDRALRPAPASIPAAATLALDAAVAIAVRGNARLKSLRAEWEAMRERPVQARALSNPTRGFRTVSRTRLLPVVWTQTLSFLLQKKLEHPPGRFRQGCVRHVPRIDQEAKIVRRPRVAPECPGPVRDHLSRLSCPPTSFLAIVATYSPWNRAMASSLSVGCREPSGPASVEAP